jgi:O-antigen ligase
MVPTMLFGVYLGVTHTEVLGAYGGVVSQQIFVGSSVSEWRVGSTFNSPFALGAASAMTFIGALAYVVSQRLGRRSALAAALAFLALGAVYVSQERAAAIGAGLGAVLVVWLSPWRTRTRLTIVIAACAVAAIFYLVWGVSNLGRLGIVADTSVYTRLDLWVFAVREFFTAPIAGHGLSSFEPLYYSNYNSFLQIGRVSAHSTLFAIAVEQGSLGLVLFTMQIWISVRLAISCVQRSKRWESVAILGAMFAYLPMLLTQDTYLQRDLTYLLYALLAAPAALACAQIAHQHEAHSGPFLDTQTMPFSSRV